MTTLQLTQLLDGDKYIVTDYAPEMLAFAKERILERKHNIDLIKSKKLNVTLQKMNGCDLTESIGSGTTYVSLFVALFFIFVCICYYINIKTIHKQIN